MNWCWLTGHKWKVVSIWNYADISLPNVGEPGFKYEIRFYCKKCESFKYESWCADAYIEDSFCKYNCNGPIRIIL